MKTYKTEGIIIKRKNYQESDRLLTVYTKHYGKLKVLAKGVRKINSRRGPNVEFFNRVEVLLYNGRSLDSLIEVKILDSYMGLKQSLTTISKAWEICELVDLLTGEKQEHQEVFNLMTDYFRRLNLYSDEVLINDFKITLLKYLGFLSKERNLDLEIDDYIESLVEKRLKTKKIYE